VRLFELVEQVGIGTGLQPDERLFDGGVGERIRLERVEHVVGRRVHERLDDQLVGQLVQAVDALLLGGHVGRRRLDLGLGGRERPLGLVELGPLGGDVLLERRDGGLHLGVLGGEGVDVENGPASLLADLVELALGLLRARLVRLLGARGVGGQQRARHPDDRGEPYEHVPAAGCGRRRPTSVKGRRTGFTPCRSTKCPGM
jgi:hypothetical protein